MIRPQCLSYAESADDGACPWDALMAIEHSKYMVSRGAEQAGDYRPTAHPYRPARTLALQALPVLFS